MFRFKSKYPIGIDIGNHNIYAAQLKENEQGLVVRELVQREFEGGDEGILEVKTVVTPLLKKIVNDNGFKGKRVVAQFPSQNILPFLWKKPLLIIHLSSPYLPEMAIDTGPASSQFAGITRNNTSACLGRPA